MSVSNPTSRLNEWDLIQTIAQRFSRKLEPGTIGIGDDTAAIPLSKNKSLLVTTDLLLEGTHFLRDDISPRDLGHKSLAVNLSDIAAKGGRPTSAFLSLGLPRDLSQEWIADFLEGLHELTTQHDISLLGGDTVESKTGIVVNFTVLGEVDSAHVRLRSQAQIGDVIALTGFTGDSAAGLKLILENRRSDPEFEYLARQHHHPKPYVTEGEWLAQQAGVHAMMDVSDGLDLTLREITHQSKCGADILMENLPLSPQLRETGDRLRWPLLEMAAAGGEDYILLVTISEQSWPSVRRQYQEKFGSPLWSIGRIADSNLLNYQWQGRPFQGQIRPWQHFQSSYQS